ARHATVGMARQNCLSPAHVLTTRIEHSPTSANGTPCGSARRGWQRRGRRRGRSREQIEYQRVDDAGADSKLQLALCRGENSTRKCALGATDGWSLPALHK